MRTVELENLLFMLIPIGVVGFIYFVWTKNYKEIVIATIRMATQLILIGYILIYIFDNSNPSLGIFITIFMILVSSFIALRNINKKGFRAYRDFVISIGIGGTVNLFLVTICVLNLEPFYQPRFIIPLAGMIYANAMNATSLAAERFEKEIKNCRYIDARAIAIKAALIPQINSFLAVGLVSLPGMMTGQILSGVDPIVAVRYQIVVMAMVLGSAGFSIITYLLLQKKYN